MKTVLIFLIFFYVSTLSLVAENIDTKMQKIREATPTQRVKLMNELKKEIALMNQDQRNEAISELRLQMSLKTQMKQVVNKEQFQNSKEIFQNQNLNQQQIGIQQIKNKSEDIFNFDRK